MVLLIAAPLITLVPTATSGVPASVGTTSHARRPDPPQHFKSERQAKAPVGLVVGGAIAVLAGICGLFFLRWLFLSRAHRREVAHAAGALPMSKKQLWSTAQIPAGESDAVPLTHCLPSPPTSQKSAEALGLEYPHSFVTVPPGDRGSRIVDCGFQFGFIPIIMDSLREEAEMCGGLLAGSSFRTAGLTEGRMLAKKSWAALNASGAGASTSMDGIYADAEDGIVLFPARALVLSGTRNGTYAVQEYGSAQPLACRERALTAVGVALTGLCAI
ncbi:hypothetical protein FB451DRAFT_1178660 [Mycena latifolia]|nr:hypothetical protein FB451DRAFT_1178660 [Mycena latifolia]